MRRAPPFSRERSVARAPPKFHKSSVDIASEAHGGLASLWPPCRHDKNAGIVRRADLSGAIDGVERSCPRDRLQGMNRQGKGKFVAGDRDCRRYFDQPL